MTLAAKPNLPQMIRPFRTASVVVAESPPRKPCKSRTLQRPRRYNSPISNPPGGKRKERPDLRTRHGHRLDEAVSSLQKSIRRGLVDDSCYWACELMEGY